jgi:peroxiredoxin
MQHLTLKAVAVASSLVLVVGGCATTGAGTGQGDAASAQGLSKAGAQAEDFTTRDIDGRTVRLGDYLGKQAVLLDFWATFCQPCMAEMPHLRRLYEAYKDKGFVILAVSMDGPESLSEVPSFARRNSMTFPVVFDEDSRIASLYNPRKSAPLSVLIDKSGRVVGVREGYSPGDEETLEKEIQAAVTVSSSGAKPRE